MRKRKKSRRKKAPRLAPQRFNGFDFGVDQWSMAVSDFQFNNLLRDAKVAGCAFGWTYSAEVKTHVPVISLAATEIAPLKSALEILKQWDHEPGDDGFALEFVLRRDGGYLLTVSPDVEALMSRLNKADRFFSRLGVNAAWIKDFPARGPWLEDFRSYFSQEVAPFVFTGCQWIDVAKPPLHVPGLPELLKFQACFSEEGATSPGTFGHAMLQTSRESGTKSASKNWHRRLPPKPQQTPEAIRERRAEQLRRHFPVNLWRLNDSQAFQAFCLRNAALNVQEWQYQQAYCNIVLSTEMTGQAHYPSAREDQLITLIAQRLYGRTELANVASPSPAADEVITKQVILDGCYLLRSQGINHSPSSVADICGQLADKNLL